ncbi:hypothetical protein OCU04_000611 [Sclerotinia nivalis]|uniref:Uncharacterized protein n=1 Tax=Sclerotinia nivalis TaxID=352851 RepID=A0A9X0AWF6_9HELO|nr:hypothetical protein OCU04_000611 [Sclerotinia nivalis]
MLRKQREGDATASAVIEIVIRFINLYVSVRTQGHMDPEKIVSEVVFLDAELERWEADLPPDCFYSVLDKDLRHESFFNGKFHEYHDIWISRMLNHYRWVRILLNELELLLEHYQNTTLPI